MEDHVGNEDAAVSMRYNSLEAGEEILVRVGLSFIEPERACLNAAEEIPTFDFDAVSSSAVSQFDDLLNRIRVDTSNVSTDSLILFYSSVARPFPS
jgi:putative alpha-1,2-mannosidase